MTTPCARAFAVLALAALCAASVSAGAPPSILKHPLAQTILAGQAADLCVDAEGALEFQWYSGSYPGNGAAVEGAIDPVFTPEPMHTTYYRVRVSNQHGSVYSDYAEVRVIKPPVITRQPQSTQTTEGLSATLTVEAEGLGPLSYQWYRGPSGMMTDPVPGATADTLKTPPLFQAATYWVLVWNAAGSEMSAHAEVEVLPNTPPMLYAQGPQQIHQTQTITNLLIAIVEDADEPPTNLVVTAITPPGVQIFGLVPQSDGHVYVTMTAAPGTPAGDHFLILTATDSAGSQAHGLITLTVTPNHPPEIDPISDLVLPINSNSGLIPVTVHDDEQDPAELHVRAFTDNEVLIDPELGLEFGGHGSNRTLFIQPRPYHTGLARITVIVTDGGGLQAGRTFRVEVFNAANAPQLKAPDNLEILGANRRVDAVLNVHHPMGNSLLKPIQVLSADHDIIHPDSIRISGGLPEPKLRLISKRDAFGEVLITLAVSDGVVTASRSIHVMVAPEDPPEPAGCAALGGTRGLWILLAALGLAVFARRRAQARFTAS
jgi:hypothetical protein